MSYYASLEPEAREKLFSVMREIDAESADLDRQTRALLPPTGHIAVGSAHFDSLIKAASLRSYLHWLRAGSTPEEAYNKAKQEAREITQRHNSQRSDINWKRDLDTAGPFLFNIHQRVTRSH